MEANKLAQESWPNTKGCQPSSWNIAMTSLLPATLQPKLSTSATATLSHSPETTLPGFATFFPRCTPNSVPLPVSTNSSVCSHRGVHSASATVNSADSRIDCLTYPPSCARSSMFCYHNTSVYSSTLSGTNAQPHLPVSSPYPTTLGASVDFPPQMKSSVFRPVGVILQRSSSENQSNISASNSTVCEGHGQHSYLYCCTPTNATNLTPSSNFSHWPAGQTIPNIAVMPAPATVWSQDHERAVTLEQFARQDGSRVSLSLDPVPYPPVPSLPPCESCHCIKSDKFSQTAEECVSNTISVVTLRAPDRSVFMSNHARPTSQTESEFSLQDVKMQLTLKSCLSDVPPPPPPLLWPVLQPFPSDAPDELHQGLDMLSDASLLVESLKSHDSNDVVSRPNRVRSLACGSEQLVSESESLLPSSETALMGLIQNGSRSSPIIYTSQVCKCMNPDNEVHYTEMNLPSVIHDMDNFQNCGTPSETPTKPYVVTLPSKKSEKYTGSRHPDHLHDHESDKDMNLCTNTLATVSSDTSSEHGVSETMNNDTRRAKWQQYETCPKRGRPRKVKSSSDQSCSKTLVSLETQSASSKRTQQNHGKVTVIDLTEHHDNDISVPSNPSMRLPVSLQTTQVTTSVIECAPGSQKNLFQQVSHGGNKVNFDIQNNCTSQKQTLQFPCHSTLVETIALPEETNTGSEIVQKAGTNSEISPVLGTVEQCPQFDPLVIAEEEVTSTQTHEEFIAPDKSTDSKPSNAAQRKEVKLRKRSHICISCFTVPSSDEDSTLVSSPEGLSCIHPKKKSKKASEKNQKRQKVSPKFQKSLTCEVCGRAFASPATLIRHKSLFHPSLFSRKTTIVELPFVASCTPNMFLSPSSSQSSLSPDIAAPSHWQASPTRKALNSKQNIRTGREEAHHQPQKVKIKREAQEKDTWRSKGHHRQRKQRRAKRNKCSVSESEQENQEVITRKAGDCSRFIRKKAQASTTRKGKSTVDSLIKNLCFRTKKRTRINSTIPCPYCKKVFSVMSNLKRHTKQRHHDVFIFVCYICKTKFNMRRILRKHIKESHSRDFPAICYYCLACFKTDPELSLHEKDHIIETFPCEDCKIVYYTEAHLGDHIARYHVTLNTVGS